MRHLRLLPTGTKLGFMRFRQIAGLASLVLCVASIGLFLFKGLNYGIDFAGGILIEIRTPQAADIGELRSRLSGLGIGAVELQEFGRETDVLIRIERQAGDAAAQNAAVARVKEALGSGVDYRRVEFVGPKVSAELIQAGVEALLFALVAMLVYIWFRFEWQFGVGAIVALAHDTILTIGVFSLLGLQFDLTTVAAILTIVGYSINDTVVVYDRVRENLRKFKTMPLNDLLDVSLNDTLSRTLLTSLTTLIAVLFLFLFGGEVIRGFSFAMMWGIIVGTYSSIFIAAPLLTYMNVRRAVFDDEAEQADGKPATRTR